MNLTTAHLTLEQKKIESSTYFKTFSSNIVFFVEFLTYSMIWKMEKSERAW